MPPKKITDAFIRTAAGPAKGEVTKHGKPLKSRRHYDTVVQGFGLDVLASGAKIFVARYRFDGEKKTLRLGRYPVLTVDKARAAAKVALGEVARGVDPHVSRATKSDAANKAAAHAAYTVDALITDFTEHHLKHRSASQYERIPRDLRRNFGSWLVTPVGEFTKANAQQMLDTAKNKILLNGKPVRGVGANRLHDAARNCFNWGVKHREEYLATNVWTKVPRPAKETPRDNPQSDETIGILFNLADALPDPQGNLLKLMILTGQREGEIAGMRWDELASSLETWTLPALRVKNRKKHTVPLSAAVIAVIQSVRRRAGSILVFEGQRQTKFQGFGQMKQRLDGMMRDAGLVPDWTFHDLRATFSTGCAKAGVPLHVTEAILNHKSGTIRGIAAVYNRYDYAKEKRLALQNWADHVIEQAENHKPSTK